MEEILEENGCRLCRLGPEDAPQVLDFLQSRMDYFTCIGEALTPQSVREGLTVRPPHTQAGQKWYVGLWREGALCAVADLVAGYPDAQTLFIGLFVVGGGAQGKGLGRRLMTELAARAGAKGVRRLRLGCVEENTAGHKFWLAMGFRDVARREHAHHGRALLVMERDC